MNRFNAQGDHWSVDHQSQSSSTLWSVEADRIAVLRDTTVEDSALSSTLSEHCARTDANAEISVETGKKCPSSIAPASIDLCRFLPSPCFPNEVPFLPLESHTTAATHAYPSDQKISAVESKDQCTPIDRMLLVTPGQWMRLRGADETWNAIQRDYYEPCICVDCCNEMFCISDAWLVLCPHCQSISPLAGNVETLRREGGIGLGFTVDTLSEVQADAWREYSS
jgi:hypothetical protein